MFNDIQTSMEEKIRAWSEAQGIALLVRRIGSSVLELYDLQKDAAELENLAERPEMAAILREHLLALHEKMILDWDFLPLPFNETIAF